MDNSKPTRTLMRKPSVKRKPPVVKQTKGSLLRMIKANPLIAVDEKVKVELGITDVELKQLGHIGIVQRTMALNPNFVAELKSESVTNNYKNSSISQIADKSNKNKMLNNTKASQLKDAKKIINTTKEHPKKIPARRSASAEKFDHKKHCTNQLLVNTSRVNSVEVVTQSNNRQMTVTPTSKPEKFNFKTPQTYRNVFTSLSTDKKFNKNNFYSSTPGNVKGKLNNWLSKRGKSLGSYHHLKCFGILQEEKENIEPPSLVRSESYESLGIIPEGQESKGEACALTPNQQMAVNYDGIARDALNDLLKLIQEGYSSDQCCEWLSMIKQKCQSVEEEPTYWECRAALEECYENLPNAIICYRTAIIKGAELKNVDESLDLLLEKFSLLNIDSNANAKDRNTKAKIIMDARNVFKSTIIQFAVHERENRKKKENTKTSSNKLITPVRRSARLSCHQKSVPRVNLWSSFKDIGETDNFDFKKNDFLSVRYN